LSGKVTHARVIRSACRKENVRDVEIARHGAAAMIDNEIGIIEIPDRNLICFRTDRDNAKQQNAKSELL
jgi:hypothetical protein